MTLKIKSPNLWNFLVSWFHDSHFEAFSDREIVNNFVRVSTKDKINSVLNEIKTIKPLIDDFWKEISKESNIFFTGSPETLKWLESIEELIEESHY